MITLNKKIIGLLLSLSFMVLGGCATDQKDPYKGQSAPLIYATAHQKMKKGYFNDAGTAYESLNTQYPFGQYAKKGDLDIIYAYFMTNQPALALASAERYIKLFPADPNLDYAYYMMGVIRFNNGRGFLQRKLPYSMDEHDPSPLLESYQAFAQLTQQFPKSPYVPDAERRMIYLYNTMAQFNLNIARFYFQIEAYVGALNRAKEVILHYPRSSNTQEALKLMAACYQKLNLNQLYQQTQSLIKLNT